MNVFDVPENAKILIAEDDTEIGAALKRILKFEGYDINLVTDGAQALEAVAEYEPDMLILDVMMPYVDGLGVCRRLRTKGDRRPMLMLTARHEVADRVAGLDAGADDYLAKPFDLDELLARVRALLRRTITGDTAESLTHHVGDSILTVDMVSRLVTVDSLPIDLTRTEFSLLELLLRNTGVVLERSVIYERIWGYDFDGESRSLDVHIGYLRRKLETAGLVRIVETVRGVGFVIRRPKTNTENTGSGDGPGVGSGGGTAGDPGGGSSGARLGGRGSGM